MAGDQYPAVGQIVEDPPPDIVSHGAKHFQFLFISARRLGRIREADMGYLALPQPYRALLGRIITNGDYQVKALAAELLGRF